MKEKKLEKGHRDREDTAAKKNRKKETGGSTRCGPRCHTRGAIPLIELLEAKSLRALTEAATADVQVVLVDETVTVRTHTAAGRTLALVVGMAVIESSVTHVYKGSSKSVKIKQNTKKTRRKTNQKNKKKQKKAKIK